MSILTASLHIFIYVVVVCPISEVLCHLANANLAGKYHDIQGEKDHTHEQDRPCAVCPRNGRCVPRIQCPAHVRTGSYNPECHLAKTGVVGVCCFTSGHAAESDHKRRSTSSISVQDVKAAHHQSHHKLTKMMSHVDELLNNHHHTIVNNSSPSFGHHLSMVTNDPRTEELGRGGLLNLFAAQDLQARQALSDEDLALGLTDHTDGPFCPPPPSCATPPNRYRSPSGECNNPANPTWGASNTGFEKILPPDYSDGIWALKASSSGLPLPSARAVSAALLPDGSHVSGTHNMLYMQFGQFIAHDVSAGVVFTIGNGSAISCCANNGEAVLPPSLQHWACAAVVTDADDAFYSQFRQTCLNFVRTQLAPSPDCSVGYAKQMNGATHYPDLSHLYGSTAEKVAALRAPGGLLAVFNDYGRELPPLTGREECLSAKEGAACFESGDNHGNQIISLTVLHTIWTREHNRIARALSRLNPDWDEDTVYLEARRLVQAEFQHIIYNEWLPILLGPQIMQTFGLAPSDGYSSSYDPNTNPSITSEFSAAAMRFGHSIADGKITVPNLSTNSVYETVSIPELMFQPSRLRLRNFLDRLLVGLTRQPMQSVDPFVTEGLTRYLFHGGNPFGLDLASINIQRGRDWGLRSYNHYRRLIGLRPVEDFYQFSPNTAQRLSSVYSTPEDIELWVGGLLEPPVEGGVVGATFAQIIADQFSRLKKGDRYFYEYGPDVNPGAFTPSQLSEIKKVTISRIVCDNTDGYEPFTLPPSAFLRPDVPGNNPVSCDSYLIPSMDLSRFKEV
ncbi:chorion peroxidase [Pectinophora gossypiella]|uniref:chorion peroxidase n=1 Tax=Pectinophora gossypiella TaxID=13191 RepID=UPI00214EF5EC|nr:chorion peroxidase [Pectinophora gossypiella]